MRILHLLSTSLIWSLVSAQSDNNHGDLQDLEHFAWLPLPSDSNNNSPAAITLPLPNDNDNDTPPISTVTTVITTMTNTPTQSPTYKPFIFTCPPPSIVGCTSLSSTPTNHECIWLNDPCYRDEAIEYEHCCQDECGRNYCTSKSYNDEEEWSEGGEEKGSGKTVNSTETEVLTEVPTPQPTVQQPPIPDRGWDDDENDDDMTTKNFQCPASNVVGCTSPDLNNISHECPTPGQVCSSINMDDDNWFTEYCCVDDCNRNYCTAKGVYQVVGKDDEDNDDGSEIVQMEMDIVEAEMAEIEEALNSINNENVGDEEVAVVEEVMDENDEEALNDINTDNTEGVEEPSNSLEDWLWGGDNESNNDKEETVIEETTNIEEGKGQNFNVLCYGPGANRPCPMGRLPYTCENDAKMCCTGRVVDLPGLGVCTMDVEWVVPPELLEMAEEATATSTTEATAPATTTEDTTTSTEATTTEVTTTEATAITATTSTEGNTLADNLWDVSDSVQALPDAATTYTGQPVTINVLFNDYVVQQQPGGWDMPDFTASLEVTDIVSNGEHGMCEITDGGSIMYIPNDTYSGSDKCGYRVCVKDDKTGEADEARCNFGALLITIEEQIISDDDFATVEPRPWEKNEPMLSKPNSSMRDEDELQQAEFDQGFDPEIEQNAINIGEGEELTTWQLSPGDRGDCSDEDTLITVEMQTDEHGTDVKWELTRDDDNTVMIEGGPYGEYSYDMVDVCLPPSQSLYTFHINDEWGDGLCDGSGMCGFYKLYLNGREIVHVNHYATNNTHHINVGYDPTEDMTMRDQLYLEAHNKRRQKWHEMYDKEYIPLIWSPKLAEESKRWAVKLLDECNSDDIEHEPGVSAGENLAKNRGPETDEDDGSPSWGQLYSPDSK